jgi:hypothetical protein
LKIKHDQLVEAALTSRFNDHDPLLDPALPEQARRSQRQCRGVGGKSKEAMAPFHAARELICSVPGIDTVIAGLIIAELAPT